MRKPSRRMPPSPSQPISRTGVAIWYSLIGMIGALLLYYIPICMLPIRVVILVHVLLNLFDQPRLARLAADRQGESICTFARSFDCRAIDTWIIRAVFEEL